MHAPHRLFEPLFTKHRATRGLECEFRLGKKNNKFFDTDVGDETFFAIKKALEKYEGWEKVEAEEYEVYNASGGRRTIYQDGDIKCSEIKTPLEKVDWVSRELPFDIRMSLATEETVPEFGSDVEYDRSCTKARTSYFRKGLRIDISIVTGSPDDHDAEEDTSYQVEFEILDPLKVRGANQFYNHLYKIKDLLDCLPDSSKTY